jgi:hypothetical protein
MKTQKIKPWLDVVQHPGELDQFILQQFKDPGTFLSLGVDDVLEGTLLANAWLGVSVYPVGTKTAKPKLTHKRIHAQLHQSPQMVPVFGGYWVRPLTVKELFFQFPGPYSVISINVESMNRLLWNEEPIQEHLPYVYVIPEDGHNEGVLHRCWDRGYTAHAVGDRLVMVKDLVLEA